MFKYFEVLILNGMSDHFEIKPCSSETCKCYINWTNEWKYSGTFLVIVSKYFQILIDVQSGSSQSKNCTLSLITSRY